MSAAWIGFLGSVVVAVLTLVGVIVSNSKTQAVTETKLEELTKVVEKHNSLIERTYKLEERVALTEEKIKVANNRIGDLEQRAG